MNDDRIAGLCALVRGIASSRRGADLEGLNSALAELSRRTDSLFRAKIVRRMASYAESSRGYSANLDDACDVLNEILWLVCQKADSFRGTTDAEAYSWLRSAIERRVSGKGRVITRRARKWRDVFRLVPKRLKRLLDSDEPEN